MSIVEVSFGHVADSEVANRPILTVWTGVYVSPSVGDKVVLTITNPDAPSRRSPVTFEVVDRLWHGPAEMYCVVKPWDGIQRVAN